MHQGAGYRRVPRAAGPTAAPETAVLLPRRGVNPDAFRRHSKRAELARARPWTRFPAALRCCCRARPAASAAR